MQSNPLPEKNKKILYIGLGGLVVIAVAVATAFLLSRVAEPSDAGSPEPTFAQQLTTVYRASASNIDQSVTLDNPEVLDSSTPNYKNAHARILGVDSDKNFAHFYRTPDETWHFFASAPDQAKLKCSLYDTEDLKNAFVGFSCVDTKGKSFVTKEQPKFEVEPGALGG